MSRDRREFTRAQKAAMVRRATHDHAIWCEGCGLNLTGKRFEFDHTVAEGLILDKSKPLTIDDGKVLGMECCHRGPDGKTAWDVKIIAKAKRVEDDHTGVAANERRLKGRGFPKSKPTKRRTEAELQRMGRL